MALVHNVEIERDEDGDNVQEQFRAFINEFKDSTTDALVYPARVKALEEPERNTVTVDYAHLEEYSADLAKLITIQFYRFYPYLTRAVALCAMGQGIVNMNKKEVYVSIENFPTKYRVRELTADRIGSLVRITGQIVRTHPVHPELCRGVFVCDECSAVIKFVEQQFKYMQPSACINASCTNRTRFSLDVHRSVFIDFQKVRIQEVQSELPRGSIPRSVEVILRGECVEMAQPGDRCDFTGTLIVVPDVSQLSNPGAPNDKKGGAKGGGKGGAQDGLLGLSSLGVRDLTYKMAFLACSVSTQNPKLGGLQYTHERIDAAELADALTAGEKQEIHDMVNDKHLEKNLVDSLFPSIYGHDEVKRGVLLMLFGGVGKTTKEQTTLRGDINVCLVGDPSTAKSQVLKTIEEFCPRAVYTSGKASSAAGLTAAVVKDEESHEFVIEAGALMLADNGVCCIDEFDKMDVKDQVAIHEAMEQQTISITKAGVKATLNARTSILAAANPIGGRYDRSKSLRNNVQMSDPIMSRFDLFFVLVDECDEVVDYAIARRILDTHDFAYDQDAVVKRVYSLERIQRYIMFARCFQPIITAAAGEALVSEYKRLRLRDTTGGAQMSASRITVRQLESLIRLSEAKCRMQCGNMIEASHVEYSSRLLHKSIVRVEQADVAFEEEEEQVNNEENQQPMEEGDEAVKQTQKFKLTYDEYRLMCDELIQHLRHEELSNDDEVGLHSSALVNWYLESIGDSLESEEELLSRKILVERVIRRMCTQEHTLVELTSTEQTGEEKVDHVDDPVIVVNPNYVFE